MSTEYQKTSEHKSYCVSRGVAHDKARKIKKGLGTHIKDFRFNFTYNRTPWKGFRDFVYIE